MQDVIVAGATLNQMRGKAPVRLHQGDLIGLKLEEDPKSRKKNAIRGYDIQMIKEARQRSARRSRTPPRRQGSSNPSTIEKTLEQLKRNLGDHQATIPRTVKPGFNRSRTRSHSPLRCGVEYTGVATDWKQKYGFVKIDNRSLGSQEVMVPKRSLPQKMNSLRPGERLRVVLEKDKSSKLGMVCATVTIL